MADQRAHRLAGCVLTALLVGASIVPAAAHAAELPRSTGTTEPETTEPETTEPETTEPDTTEPDTTEPDTTDGDGDSDDPTVAIIAVVAFAALIGLASWWMVRRNDDDDAPHPRPQNLDAAPPGQDLF